MAAKSMEIKTVSVLIKVSLSDCRKIDKFAKRGFSKIIFSRNSQNL